MNKQSTKDMLQGITQEDAAEILHAVFEGRAGVYGFEYHAWPQVFANTKGPFSYPGCIAGQAMTTFTIEAWTDNMHSVLFCKGRVLDVRFHPSGFYVEDIWV